MTDTPVTNPTSVAGAAEEVTSPVSKCGKYSHQVRLLPITNQISVNNIPYVFIIKDKRESFGNTDSQGKTSRIRTNNAEEVTTLVGKLASSYLKRKDSFGSLGNIDERKIKITTANNEPTHDHPYAKGYDYIVVTAARTAPRDWRWQGGFGLTAESAGNQYRFINCGLRQLRFFPEASKRDHATQRIHVVFQQGYTQNDINRINAYTKKLDARIVYVRNVSEFIHFLNERKVKQRFIKQLVIYCHGIFNHASFHYKGDNESAGLFGLNDITRVEEPIFDYDTLITTYACRAGISVDGDDLTGKDAGQINSQAQKMADTWDVKVKAFEMRSSYVGIYGTGTEINEARNYSQTIINYQRSLMFYEVEKASGNKDAKPPQKPANYDEMVQRYNDLMDREKNEKDGGGPIAPSGAWGFPGTGDTPKGLQRGLQDYQPREWQS